MIMTSTSQGIGSLDSADANFHAPSLRSRCRWRRLKSASPLRFDEVAAPSGGPWGSTYVDAEFEKFVAALIGQQNFAKYKASPYWIDMLEAWEKVKVRAAHPSISRARGRRCHLLSRPRAP